MDENQEKTEEPTPHRLEKAREEGQIFFSKDLNHWFLLFSFLLCFLYALPYPIHELFCVSRALLSAQSTFSIQHIFIQFFSIFIVFCFCFIFPPVISHFFQTKGLVSLKSLQPKMERISPVKGLKRIFSTQNTHEFFKNIIKLSLILVIVFFIIFYHIRNIVFWINFSIQNVIYYYKFIVSSSICIILSIFFLIACFDFWWQRHHFMKKMRMTRQETKEEFKEMESDPKMRQEIKRRQRNNRVLARIVPEATMVITNPTHISIVLKWDESTMIAPKISAKGIDEIALHIRMLAKDHHIPIFSSPLLARALYYEVKIDDAIPPHHYRAVADIIRFVKGL